MATLVLGAAGAAIGGSVGGAVLGISAATIGGAIGTMAGSVVDSWIVGALQPDQRYEGARLDSLQVTSATEGATIPRVFGRMRLGGNIIWATDFTEHVSTTTQGGGKGGGPSVTTTEYSYTASFAVALCDGPITGIGRIWADGELLDTSTITWRWYPGDEAQAADPFIAAKMGSEGAPAWRGTAYVVFEELDLTPFGNRIPQLSFEVFAPVADADTAEGAIRAVTMIPGAGEFVHASEPVMRTEGAKTTPENVHAETDRADFLVSLDRLEALAPGVESVSLVVSWFGDDLRCDRCQIKPGVETATKTTTPQVWQVNGLDRASAHLVSTDAEGRPVYGGTPSDAAVVQAIKELKARGYRVTFYPFLLMDVPEGNTLPDPYSDNAAAIGQPALPWRGRITCSPAAGFAGSVDKTATAEAQVAAFFGNAQISDFAVSGETVSWTGGNDWGWRRMILHYAHLCAAAGGVDAFLIGSELRGLTQIRNCERGYPAVAQLQSLAADVHAILGPSTKISYAADWSEYNNHQIDEPYTDLLSAAFADTAISAPLASGVSLQSRRLLPDYGQWRLNSSIGSAPDPAAVTLGRRVAYTTDMYATTFQLIIDIDATGLSPGETVTYSDTLVTNHPSGLTWNDQIKLIGYTQADLDAIDPDGYLSGSLPGTQLANRNLIGSGSGTLERSLSWTVDRTDIAMIRVVVELEEPKGGGSYLAWYECPSVTVDRPSSSLAFHLDPLWADANIDFIGIDNYMAVSDWRDGFEHADAQAGWHAIYDRAYLQSNIEGGEGFDWFYASDADRDAQLRTPITDGAYGKDWVFRAKDLRSWWSNAHHDRLGGVESGTPTAWVPESKPIRFTEFGCPAIDRGTNQPNVFFDPKSSESAAPYFSRGWRDDAIQRAYLEATALYWGDPAHNSVSSVTGLPMIDTADCAAWTWDARPHPFFPALTDVWSDGDNWRLGHWLTGRLGSVSLAALVRHLCLAAGMDAAHIDVSGLWGAVEGLTITAIESPRTTLSMLARHFGFDAVESEGVIRFVMRGRAAVATLTPGDLVAGNAEDIERSRGQETELPQVLRWSVARADEDYDSALVEARRIITGAVRVTAESFPVAVAPEEAERRCRRALMEAWVGREHASFSLPPSRLALDPGDVVEFADGATTEFRLSTLADGFARRIEATRQDREAYDLAPGAPRAAAVARSVPLGAPQVAILDLPQLTSAHTPPRPLIAVDADPWPGTVAVLRSPETSGWSSFATITRRARIGSLVTDLPTGSAWRWDRGTALEIDLPWGQLESVTDLQLFAGANAFAVESAPGAWEILQARDVALVAPGRYRLTTLLRGQRGTEAAIGNPAPAGARVVVLDAAVAELPFTAGEIGLPWNLAVGPATRPVSDPSYSMLSLTPSGISLRPFAPVHLGATAEPTGDITLSWTPRSRAPAADSWTATDVPILDTPEAWEIDILDGATVKRTLATGTTSATYTAAHQTADWGAVLAPGATLTIRVTQLSPTVGRGSPAEATLTIT
ncbi:Gene Transfer Agent (GTA)-like protein [Albidovulum inexpectatum]|uniref:Gene Transfer Agent (GTA)-like protein n=1 Tax=Albidovulum inexpectatum TaxID=196587 RepID=A0A2S5JDA7_9RHOB|nr:glycoside hydrolase TIM-barrel-like domain-containing protein [Albidovulum inexpectatum]PPB79453.1 Gene Transfer Agent (GTA)-like protein [Albidovulum inexpectatum]